MANHQHGGDGHDHWGGRTTSPAELGCEKRMYTRVCIQVCVSL
jgi:hypothetical protein